MLKFWQKHNTYYMTKKKLTLSIDEEVLKRAKKSGVNLSQLFENTLKYGIAPKADRISRLPYGPLLSYKIKIPIINLSKIL